MKSCNCRVCLGLECQPHPNMSLISLKLSGACQKLLVNRRLILQRKEKCCWDSNPRSLYLQKWDPKPSLRQLYILKRAPTKTKRTVLCKLFIGRAARRARGEMVVVESHAVWSRAHVLLLQQSPHNHNSLLSVAILERRLKSAVRPWPHFCRRREGLERLPP